MIDSSNFLTFFDNDYRLVKELEFRRSIFRNGISKNFRDIVWRFLFQFYSFNSTKRERFIKNKEKMIEYSIMKMRWNKIYDKLKTEILTKNENFDQVNIPALDFNLKIDFDQDIYKNGLNKDLYLVEENQELNIDYIKIQTILKISRIKISNSKLLDDIRQIDKDVERTGYLAELEDNTEISHSEKQNTIFSLRNILITFAAFNQSLSESNLNLGYTQGMNELASVFLSVFNEESVAYWCFSNFMLLDTYSNSSLTLNTTQLKETHVLKTNVAHYFSDLGISKKLNHLTNLLTITDQELFCKLKEIQINNLNFCHEWLLLCFKRCFKSTKEFQNIFEIQFSNYLEFYNSSLKNISVKNLYSFDLFICLSILNQIREKILNLNNDIDFYEMFSEFNKSSYISSNFGLILKQAEDIFDKYCIISSNPEEDQNKKKQETSTIDKLKGFIFN